MFFSKKEIEERDNTRAFLLMARHGKASLFCDLNKRYFKLLETQKGNINEDKHNIQ